MTEKGIRVMMASIAVSATMGVFMHDSHLDNAAITAFTTLKHEEAESSNSKVSPQLHVHGEHLKVKKRSRTSNPEPRSRNRTYKKRKNDKKPNRGGFRLLPALG